MKKIFSLIIFGLLSVSVQAQWTMLSASQPTVYAQGGTTVATFVVEVQDPFASGTGIYGADIVISSGSPGIDITDISISPDPGPMSLTGSGTSRQLSGGSFTPGTYTISYTLQDNGSITTLPLTVTTDMQISDYGDGSTYGMDNSEGTTLPVTLASFNVTKEGSKVATLSWKTTEETNSDYFEVQHSLNAKDWEAVGKVQSHNDGKAIHNYSFSYAGKTNGKNYFRLNMVDLDGTSQRSSVRSVTFENLADEMVSFGPNPTSDYLNITLSDWSTVKSVSILDKIGRNVYSSGAKPENTISVRNFNSGLYLLKLTRNNGEVIVNKILVNK